MVSQIFTQLSWPKCAGKSVP